VSPSLPSDVAAGQAVYNRLTLAVYDLALYAISCRFTWKCDKREMLRLFEENLSPHHLDAGVGTGYLLDKCRKPGPDQRIALVDLNDSALAHAARRLARYRPVVHRANVLEPLRPPGAPFGSASLSLLLHCLPGSMADKARAFDHVAACVEPGGRVFGSTILAAGVPVNRGARFQMGRLNRARVFQNAGDSLDALHEQLGKRFRDYTVDVRGCVALFRATVDAPEGGT
jgi:SAM-dependent methyltransferase